MSTPEPYKIKTIESIYRSTFEEREQWIKEAKYNLFNLKSPDAKRLKKYL